VSKLNAVTNQAMGPSPEGKALPLKGIKVIELADEQAEYCGLLLAGLGATVVKVEPPGGSPTRKIGPFVDDRPSPEYSLYFWHYNREKQSIVLDLDEPKDVETFRGLVLSADVLLETTPREYLPERQLALDELRAAAPHLVTARVTPFGDDGPWADWKGSDLVHLALGGPMMNCGYDPLPDGTYDLPPIAPQMWHSYHIAGGVPTARAAVWMMDCWVLPGPSGAPGRAATPIREQVSRATSSKPRPPAISTLVTAAGSSRVRSSNADATCARSTAGRTSASDPPGPHRPNGDRTASAITTSSAVPTASVASITLTASPPTPDHTHLPTSPRPQRGIQLTGASTGSSALSRYW
jgi:hypothetical protein